jgi:hypothetical protein
MASFPENLYLFFGHVFIKKLKMSIQILRIHSRQWRMCQNDLVRLKFYHFYLLRSAPRNIGRFELGCSVCFNVEWVLHALCILGRVHKMLRSRSRSSLRRAFAFILKIVAFAFTTFAFI